MFLVLLVLIWYLFRCLSSVSLSRLLFLIPCHRLSFPPLLFLNLWQTFVLIGVLFLRGPILDRLDVYRLVQCFSSNTGCSQVAFDNDGRYCDCKIGFGRDCFCLSEHRCIEFKAVFLRLCLSGVACAGSRFVWFGLVSYFA